MYDEITLGNIFCEKKKEIGWGPIGGKRLNLDGRGGGQTGLFIPKPTKHKKLKKIWMDKNGEGQRTF